MNCTNLYQLIADPALLSEKTLPDLQQIVNDFPYFHAARMLYLGNLAVLKDIRENVELKKMAIHIPDRTKLFLLIEGDKYRKPVVLQSNEILDREKDNMENVTPLRETEDTETTLTDESLTFEPASWASSDYTQLITNDPKSSVPSAPRLQHQELIDSFIHNENHPFSNRIKLKPVEINDDSDEMIKVPDGTEKSLDDSYFTETLANIYIKQKRYDRALEIIKSLSLKYPKKNIYFADQIRYLEKLIVHTQKK
ncbi:MAG: hypothetical protein LBE79_06800 [Tannerella sp.]|jgi:hypothetical protein|nr:hypothetical protein [Tannerella sp.]